MDVTAWILGSTIVVLAAVDLVVWASLRDGPNPIAKFFAAETQGSTTAYHARH